MAELEKFQELPHMNSLYEVQEDWAYTPNLYHFEGEWHVSWIHCSEGDALNDFSGSTPEEAIGKAYNWFQAITKGDIEKEGTKTKFKVGDTIRNKQWPTACHTIESIDSESYYLDNGGKIEIVHQDLWEFKQPVSNDLEEAACEYADGENPTCPCEECLIKTFKAGAQWQKEHLWKDAQGDDLPEIDREVIVLVKALPEHEDSLLKVSIAHRPPKYWMGKSISTGEITRYEPKRYDKGGWNQPAVVWWLDVELPKEEE